MREASLIDGGRTETPGPAGFRPDPIRSVDEAVRSVLRELGREGRHANSDGAVFAERLLALRHVEALARGTRELRLAPGTVVTPLALQALKQRDIAVRYVSRSEVNRVKRVGEWGFASEVETGVVAALRRTLLDGPDPWIALGSWPEVSRWLVEQSDRGAVWLAEEASVAVWRACQVAGVRAATAESCEAVSRAVRHLGVNLLVIEPAGKSIALMKQMSQTLRTSGAPRNIVQE